MYYYHLEIRFVNFYLSISLDTYFRMKNIVLKFENWYFDHFKTGLYVKLRCWFVRSKRSINTTREFYCNDITQFSKLINTFGIGATLELAFKRYKTVRYDYCHFCRQRICFFNNSSLLHKLSIRQVVKKFTTNISGDEILLYAEFKESPIYVIEKCTIWIFIMNIHQSGDEIW